MYLLGGLATTDIKTRVIGQNHQIHLPVIDVKYYDFVKITREGAVDSA